MNSTKKNSEFGGVKKKLTAAIAMLLVATIMMVSSTYAWFTLSTAPEVTGITTSVGANGNLEMALLPKDGDMTKINTSVGDSTKSLNERNLTWGNLVDFTEDASTNYGFKDITLNPARLNVNKRADNTYSLNTASALLTATYGPDGRVDTLAANTLTAIYANGGFTTAAVGTEYGVRAIGSTSNMNAMQLGYRNAVASASTNAANAKSEAVTTISTNGEALTKILIKHYTTTDGTDTYTAADLNTIKAMATDLKKALKNVDGALRQYAVGVYATTSNLEESVFTTGKAVILNTETKLSTIVDTYASSATTLKTTAEAVEGKITSLDNLIKKIEGQTGAESGATSWKWSKSEGDAEGTVYVSELLEVIAKPSSMTINGVPLNGGAETVKKDLPAALIRDKLLVKVNMPQGSGIFADVANYVGTYSADFTAHDVPIEGVGNVQELSTNITASQAESGGYVIGNLTWPSAPSKGDNETANQKITDTYGYIIDLAVRTNAASAKLLLSEAQQRIYDGSDNADTMGKGSTMSFKTSAGFGDDLVKALMSNIRVVFLDGTGKVLGVAALDMEKAALDAEKGWTAPLHLYQYSFGTAETVNEERVACGALTLTTEMQGDKKVLKRVDADKDVLCDLTQNTATKISALVYLDGDAVSNKDVANAAESMSGSMNLQFSTDVDLVPMHYTPLEGTITKPTTTPGNDEP